MTMYYRDHEEEGGGGKTRPSLDYLRERSGGGGGTLPRQPPTEVCDTVVVCLLCITHIHSLPSSAFCHVTFIVLCMLCMCILYLRSLSIA